MHEINGPNAIGPTGPQRLGYELIRSLRWVEEIPEQILVRIFTHAVPFSPTLHLPSQLPRSAASLLHLHESCIDEFLQVIFNFFLLISVIWKRIGGAWISLTVAGGVGSEGPDGFVDGSEDGDGAAVVLRQGSDEVPEGGVVVLDHAVHPAEAFRGGGAGEEGSGRDAADGAQAEDGDAPRAEVVRGGEEFGEVCRHGLDEGGRR